MPKNKFKIHDNESFSLKKSYSESWSYIKSSKNFIFISILFFVLFFLIGFFLPAPENISKTILDFLKNLIDKTKDMSHIQLIGFIFFNNLQSSFFAMILGVGFGIFPFISSIINGYLLGFVSGFVVESNNLLSLWRILPHGIFELPAMFISFGLGIRLGFSFFNKKKLGDFTTNFIYSLKVFIQIVLPLLVIAAIIEGTLIFLKI